MTQNKKIIMRRYTIMIKKIFFDESGFTGNFRIKNKKFQTNDNGIFILVGI